MMIYACISKLCVAYPEQDTLGLLPEGLNRGQSPKAAGLYIHMLPPCGPVVAVNLWYLQEIQLSEEIKRQRWMGSSRAQPNAGT